MENWQKISFNYHQIPSWSVALIIRGHQEISLLMKALNDWATNLSLLFIVRLSNIYHQLTTPTGLFRPWHSIFYFYNLRNRLCSSFPATNSFVFFMPVFLLTFDAAVGCVPTTMVHSFFLTIVTLENRKRATSWENLSGVLPSGKSQAGLLR